MNIDEAKHKLSKIGIKLQDRDGFNLPITLFEKAWTLKIFLISLLISAFVIFLQKQKIEFQHEEERKENREQDGE